MKIKESVRNTRDSNPAHKHKMHELFFIYCTRRASRSRRYLETSVCATILYIMKRPKKTHRSIDVLWWLASVCAPHDEWHWIVDCLHTGKTSICVGRCRSSLIQIVDSYLRKKKKQVLLIFATETLQDWQARHIISGLYLFNHYTSKTKL